MKIEGRIGQSELGYVTAYVMSRPLDIQAPVRFYVDTGACQTTIADRDAQRIGIDYARLEMAETRISGIGGTVDTYKLPECMIVFQTNRTILIEQLDEILVMRHGESRDEEEARRIQMVPSLLGVDVLKGYSVRFTQVKVILEK